MSVEIFNAARWHEFFLLVGTGAFTLTGLVFVAMSINLKEVTKDATHRYRAISTLSGFTGIFMFSLFALMDDQSHGTLGMEWFIFSAIAGGIFINSYIQAIRKQGSDYALSLGRTLLGAACYLGQLIGSVLIMFDMKVGLYMAAVGLILNFYFMISGAWLLVVGPISVDHR